MAVLLTGSTGSVGHAILKALSNQGIQTVIIVRDLGARKLKLPANTIAIEGDICKTNAGIDQETINTLKTNGVTALIHSAGLVKFDNKFEPELVQTNVEGTKNVLSLADKLNVSHFHHISTAYVVGEHVNPYEKSKWLAEKCVEDFHIPYTIYRPSIVVGDSSTGEIKNYDGIYGLTAALAQIAAGFKKNSNLTNCLVDLPISLPHTLGSKANLIPSDWIAKVITHQVIKPSGKKILFLAHPKPIEVQTMYDFGLKELGIKSVQFNTPTVTMNKEAGRFQKLANRMLARYTPYMVGEQYFPVLESLEGVPLHYWEPIPRVDGDLFAFYLRKAAQDNFGK